MAGPSPDPYRPRRAYDAEPEPAAGPPDSPGEEASQTAPAGPAVESRHQPAGTGRDPDPGADGRSRGKLALLVLAVAAVVALGLAAGYAVLRPGSVPAAAPPPGAPRASAPEVSASEPPEPPPAPDALLTDDRLLTAQGAEKIDDGRAWKVTLTQRGLGEESPRPACLGSDQGDGLPPAQQTVLRLLSSSGKKSPDVLQQASAYPTPEEAAQAYAVTEKALGGCDMAGGSIESGARVRGLGDSASGLVVRVLDGSRTQFRTVVLARTGRVVDVVDVAAVAKPVPVSRAVKAAAAAVAAQCRPAGGRCAEDVSVSPGPPPLGGDEPGFLAPTDLPVVGPEAAGWIGDQPGAPKPTFTGSQCESVDWAKEKAETRAQRTYVQAEGGTFGLDEIILRRSSASAAKDLVRRVRTDLTTCEDRLLTATVADLDDLDGTGAGGVDITGWATTVSQKAASGTTRYRVAMVAAGDKAVFTFLNPEKGLDFTDDQWRTVAVRAGERATQAR